LTVLIGSACILLAVRILVVEKNVFPSFIFIMSITTNTLDISFFHGFIDRFANIVLVQPSAGADVVRIILNNVEDNCNDESDSKHATALVNFALSIFRIIQSESVSRYAFSFESVLSI
jgi:hypothetical protein